MPTTKEVFKRTYKGSELYDMYVRFKSHKEVNQAFLAEHYEMTQIEVQKRLDLAAIVFHKPMTSWDRNVMNKLRRCMVKRGMLYPSYRKFGTSLSDFEKLFGHRIGQNSLLRGPKIDNLRIINHYGNILIEDVDVERFDKWLLTRLS